MSVEKSSDPLGQTKEESVKILPDTISDGFENGEKGISSLKFVVWYFVISQCSSLLSDSIPFPNQVQKLENVRAYHLENE